MLPITVSLIALYFSFRYFKKQMGNIQPDIENINRVKIGVEESLITDYNELYYPSCIVCLANGDFSETLN